MKIETKFDIGQKVWRIARACKTTYGGYGIWTVLDRKQPKKIDLIGSNTYKQGTVVHYGFAGVYGIRSSDEMFLTKAAAQTECDRRNSAIDEIRRT